MAVMFCSEISYRRAADAMNACLHRGFGKEIKLRTLADFMETYGSKISGHVKGMAGEILKENWFDAETLTPLDDAAIPENVLKPGERISGADDAEHLQKVRAVVEEINSQRECDAQIKRQELVDAVEPSASKCCYISIDDIGVKQQKNTRKDGGTKDGHYVENTVIHVQADGKAYFLTAVSMREAFAILLAFLLNNNLMDKRKLVFLADGAKNILSYIEACFPFCEHTVILDWYHLKKKCKELISSSIKGNKDEKKMIIQTLLRMLWVGNVDESIAFLKGLSSQFIKSTKWFDELTSYLDRKKPQIACYALRKSLGLRNSSNRVEKANDMLVAQRQKHNGMSWSRDGSGALAAINMVILNNEADRWLYKNTISFAFPKDKTA
jgi:hypothetical protein